MRRYRHVGGLLLALQVWSFLSRSNIRRKIVNLAGWNEIIYCPDENLGFKGYYLIFAKLFIDQMECKIIELPRILDARGNLSFLEGGGRHIPFDIARAYWIYDVPGGENRGEHAHKTLAQLLVAVSGSFSVMMDDGHERREVFLNRPYKGLVVPPGVWHHLHDFSSGAVALAFASDIYKESDYIRDYNDFLEFVKGNDKIS